jgi:hypothetical protein
MLIDDFNGAVPFDVDLALPGLNILQAGRGFSRSGFELEQVPQCLDLRRQHVVDCPAKSVVAAGANSLCRCFPPPSAFKRMCSGFVVASSSVGQNKQSGISESILEQRPPGDFTERA